MGFLDGQLVAAGLRVDPDPRQDPWRFDRRRLEKQVEKRMQSAAASGGNRLIEQLEHCALTYGCRAAQNYFIGRHEAPLPTSVTCNAQCVGCISLQTDGQFRASHDRLDRAPTPAEVTAVALEHIEKVPEAIVSFGQGCEGEPLLAGDLLIASTRMIRAATDAGTIHLNSNASKPEVVDELAATGLDSMRVSMNSARPEIYAAYYRPHKYGFEDVRASMAAMKRRGRFLSINYLVFPGVTDTEAEAAALEDLIAATGIDLVQLRNLNIDPEAYFACLPAGTVRPGFGIRQLMARLQARFPRLRFGYFNPPKERYKAWGVEATAPVEPASPAIDPAKLPAMATREKTTRRRKKAAPEPTGLTPVETRTTPPPPEIERLIQEVEADGGTVLAPYREPFGGRWVLLVALPLERVVPSPFQRKASPLHIGRLRTVIEKVGRFLDPVIVVRQTDGTYWTPNGNHRLQALRRWAPARSPRSSSPSRRWCTRSSPSTPRRRTTCARSRSR